MSQPPYDQPYDPEGTAYQPPPPTVPPPYYPPTEQLPPYGQRPYGQPPYGQQPYGYGPYGPPGSPYGPYGPPPGPKPPRRSRTGLVVALVALAVVLLGGLAGAIALAVHNTRDAVSDASGAAPSFPSISIPSFTVPPFSVPGGPVQTGSDTPTGGPTATTGGTSEQLTIARNATTFLHALAAGQPAVFCPLWDPTDLKQVLQKNNVSNCNELELSSATAKAQDAQYSVLDPSQIDITADADAVIPSAAVQPDDYSSDVVLHKDTDGGWKVVFTAG